MMGDRQRACMNVTCMNLGVFARDDVSFVRNVELSEVTASTLYRCADAAVGADSRERRGGDGTVAADRWERRGADGTVAADSWESCGADGAVGADIREGRSADAADNREGLVGCSQLRTKRFALEDDWFLKYDKLMFYVLLASGERRSGSV